MTEMLTESLGIWLRSRLLKTALGMDMPTSSACVGEASKPAKTVRAAKVDVRRRLKKCRIPHRINPYQQISKLLMNLKASVGGEEYSGFLSLEVFGTLQSFQVAPLQSPNDRKLE